MAGEGTETLRGRRIPLHAKKSASNLAQRKRRTQVAPLFAPNACTFSERRTLEPFAGRMPECHVSDRRAFVYAARGPEVKMNSFQPGLAQACQRNPIQ
jgi:hypothetical protein